MKKYFYQIKYYFKSILNKNKVSKNLLDIFDFPIKIENNLLKNCKDVVILNLNKADKNQLLQFIQEIIPAVNDGRRVYKRRLTKTLLNYSQEDAIDIVKTEMFEKGYIQSEGISEIEYNIICKEGKIKINFNKILKNMEEVTDIQNIENVNKLKISLKNSLIKIFDAKSQNNLTDTNKDIALKDLLKLLNLYWEKAVKSKKEINQKGFINIHQDIWHDAILEAYKEIKYPLLTVTSNLFKSFVITLFGSIGKDDILYQLTNWNSEMLSEEKMTHDTKILLLSINKLIQDNQEQK